MSGGVRPPHLRWRLIGLVALGGGAGAACREALSLLLPSIGAVPLAIPAVNVTGAFLLGCLYAALTGKGSRHTSGMNLRLLLGTGFCGGFTTYSALARDTSVLLQDGLVPAALAYAFGTVVLGACATWAGIALSTAVSGRTADRPRGKKDRGRRL
ncbi:CrcB family protein [Arthrobacter gandavensis]|uniref:fluoride efflux transporter FluC n=1 Tax=Arthrobacter gandavensis TaxID=169960 RepID=UPI00188DDB2D|nr:CrcB family protein [Arthrobacter gandavensis]MBF4994889.1 CrcB family protein [Arthrobacter gandavensis]